MRLVANEKSLHRIHLVGTLLIVLLLTGGLAGYNLWQSRQDAQVSFDRIEQALTEQIGARLRDEMHYAITTIEHIRGRTEAVLRESIIQQVDSAYQIAEAIHTRESGRRPPAEVQKMIVETLRPVRFYEGRGYFFIDDMNGQFILLPTPPQFEGKTLLDNQDDTGHFIMRGLISAAKLPGGQGFSRYRWYTPEDPSVMAEKLSYVRYFEPYGWLIGTGDYLYKWEERQKQEAVLHLRTHRFGTTGQAELYDASGRGLVLPSDSEFEGKTAADLPVLGREVLEKLQKTARDGGGIVHYEWPQAGTGAPAKRTAFVQTYAPWQWVVVTTLCDDEMQAAVAAEQQTHAQISTQQALTNMLAGLMALLLGVAASWLFSRWMRQLFKEYHRNNLEQQEALRRQAEALRETQASLQESEHHFRTLANGGTALIWTSGTDKQCNYFNEPWLRYTGRTLEQECGNGWAQGVHPDDFDRWQETYFSHFERREPFAMEYRLRRANGQYGWILDLGNPRHDSEGNFTGYIGYCYDITERKQTETKLAESEALLSRSQEVAHVGSWRLDLSTNTLVWSDEVYRIFGCEPQEFPATYEGFFEFIYPDDRAAVDEAYSRSVKENRDIYEIEHRIVQRNSGAIRVVYERCINIRNEAGDIIQSIGMVQDITERRLLEQERTQVLAKMAQSQRLESIGTLASGVAHEINNPLNVVMNFAQLILDEPEVPANSREYAAAIVSEGDRMAGIVRSLLAFSRNQLESPSLADLGTLVNDTLVLVRALYRKEHIDVITQIPERLPKIRCRSQQLQQVLMNLLSNARDALNLKFPGGSPEKCIRITAQPFERERVNWVRLTIEDRGGGIPVEVADRIFDPFFTTKTKDKGTGLGLSISHGIVKDHGGTMWFESDAGVGTRFHLELPANDGWSEF